MTGITLHSAAHREREIQTLAEKIYLAKLQGFWANPDSRCELEEPSMIKCVEDAEEFLKSLENVQASRFSHVRSA